MNVVGDPAVDRCVASDDAGDFVVVWIQYESNNTTDVFMRLYDNTGNPLTNEEMVNTYTTGNQTEPSVAMDADGDYVIVWASQGQDPDGSWGIYGQRFNSLGSTVGGEFRVNTNTANDQVSPDVAMDSQGDFIVVWATQGQSYSYFNTVKGQIYGYNGSKLGGEFAVNSQNIPGTGLTASNNQLHPSIAMSQSPLSNSPATFMVVWTAVTSQFNGVATGSVIKGRELHLELRRGHPDDDPRQQHRVPSQRRVDRLHPFRPRGLRPLARDGSDGEQRPGGDGPRGQCGRRLGGLSGQRHTRPAH